ncbi:enoyl-CoA hydratase-related protein [Nocardia sp. NPDC051463]|uniref:enoyl-CoA hydratase-related protein n=1 Tax=Nocardia sp. NPDC051463 TaxID=3154845 RepID=UPI00342908EA
MSSADNGLTRRAGLALRRSGRMARTAVVTTSSDIEEAVGTCESDLVICPFLTIRIPESVYTRLPTVVIHPGPVGDRGGSSLDWAISEDEPLWGVTALSAVGTFDSGPIWATRTFALPRLRKSLIYNGQVTSAAVECILEVADKAADPNFRPLDQERAHRAIPHVRARRLMRQSDRAFDWASDPEQILRHIRAADGAPGVVSTLAQRPVRLYDAHPGRSGLDAAPGTLLGRRHHAVEVACGGGASIWIGHLSIDLGDRWSCKAPSTATLARAGIALGAIPTTTAAAVDDAGQFADITYRRLGPVGEIGAVEFDSYNGGMTESLCRRLTFAIRAAARQGTKVLVVRGRDHAVFSNGLHLGEIEISHEPAQQAWRTIRAINALCREILFCPQLSLVAMTSAGAGGAMLPLSADVVVATGHSVIDAHYRTMGLGGSELHSYTLPRRVGADTAHRLLEAAEPIDALEALDIGFVDHVGPDIGFDDWLTALAGEYVRPQRWLSTLERTRGRLARDLADKPLDAYEFEELGEMARNLFSDSLGFEAKRRAFLYKTPYSGPERDSSFGDRIADRILLSDNDSPGAEAEGFGRGRTRR